MTRSTFMAAKDEIFENLIDTDLRSWTEAMANEAQSILTLHESPPTSVRDVPGISLPTFPSLYQYLKAGYLSVEQPAAATSRYATREY